MDLNRGGSSSVFHGMIITRLRIYQKMRSSLLLSDVLPDGWSKSDWRERLRKNGGSKTDEYKRI